jgi:hypothetical protein
MAHKAQRYTEPVTIWLADSFHRAGLFRSIQESSCRHMLTLAMHVCERRHHERVDVAGGLVTRAWEGASPYIDAGLWRFGPELLNLVTVSRADEWRVLLNVQSAIESGIEVGAQMSSEWIHLGGTEPSFEGNIREVTRFFLDADNVDQ